jgi:hypothetical protein
VNTLKRVKELSALGQTVFATPCLAFFLDPLLNISHYIHSPDADERKLLLDKFAQLEDNDIMAAAKVWAEHPDRTLSILSKNLINRKLYKIEIQHDVFPEELISVHKKAVEHELHISGSDLDYFVFSGAISNNAYKTNDDRIKILLKSGAIVDITEASDMLDQSVLAKTVKKHFLCYPKGGGW